MLPFAQMKNAFPTDNASRWLTLCGLLLFVVLAVWATFFVPMNMDESLAYHNIACATHPDSALHSFREACDHHNDLTLPFGGTIHRPYPYIGALQGILFTPFYDVLPAPVMQYVYGLIFFVAFAWGLSRFSAKPHLTIALTFASLPLLVQFTHDDGIVKFGMLTFPLGALLFKRVVNTTGAARLCFTLLFVALIALAVEDKIFFLYMLPAFALFCLALLDAPNWHDLAGKLQQIAGSLVIIALLSGTAILMILLATRPNGGMYLFWLREFAEQKHSWSDMAQYTALFSLFWAGFAHHIYNIRSELVAMAFTGTLTLGFYTVCGAMAWQNARQQPNRIAPRTVLLALSLAAMLGVFAVFRNVWSGHHFIYLWVPLLMLLHDLLSKLRDKDLLAVGGFYLFLNAASLCVLLQSPLDFAQSREREKIFAYASTQIPAGQSIVNFSSWGAYFIHALYAPRDQLVTYIQPLTPKDAGKLLAIVEQTGRKIYDVCLVYEQHCNPDVLSALFDSKLVFTDEIPALSEWKIYLGTPR